MTLLSRRRRERQAVRRLLRVIDQYPPEVFDRDGAWRIGGAAKSSWRWAIQELREAVR